MAIAIKEFNQYFGVNNALLVGGTITYYEAVSSGPLTTEKEVYSDPAMTNVISSTQDLNSLGTTDDTVYLTYPYGIILKDANGATVKTVPWVSTNNTSGAGAEAGEVLVSSTDQFAKPLVLKLLPGTDNVSFAIDDEGADETFLLSVKSYWESDGSIVSPKLNETVSADAMLVDGFDVYGLDDSGATSSWRPVLHSANSDNFELPSLCTITQDGTISANKFRAYNGIFNVDKDSMSIYSDTDGDSTGLGSKITLNGSSLSSNPNQLDLHSQTEIIETIGIYSGTEISSKTIDGVHYKKDLRYSQDLYTYKDTQTIGTTAGDTVQYDITGWESGVYDVVFTYNDSSTTQYSKWQLLQGDNFNAVDRESLIAGTLRFDVTNITNSYIEIESTITGSAIDIDITAKLIKPF